MMALEGMMVLRGLNDIWGLGRGAICGMMLGDLAGSAGRLAAIAAAYAIGNSSIRRLCLVSNCERRYS